MLIKHSRISFKFNIHFIYISYTFHIHFIYISYTFRIHFIYISYTFRIHFIYISYTFHIHFVYISYTFRIHFVYISYTFRIHFVYISYTFRIHFVYISYTFRIHFVYISYTFHIHFVYISYTFRIHFVSCYLTYLPSSVYWIFRVALYAFFHAAVVFSLVSPLKRVYERSLDITRIRANETHIIITGYRILTSYTFFHYFCSQQILSEILSSTFIMIIKNDSLDITRIRANETHIIITGYRILTSYTLFCIIFSSQQILSEILSSTFIMIIKNDNMVTLTIN